MLASLVLLAITARADDVVAELAAWTAAVGPLDLVTDEALVVDGLAFDEGELSVRVHDGWAFPILDGAATGEPARRAVGFVLIGHGDVALRFPVHDDAVAFANHWAVDEHRPAEEVAGLVHGDGTLRAGLEALIVLDPDPALHARLDALDYAALHLPRPESLGDASALVVPERAGFTAAQAAATTAFAARHVADRGDEVAFDRLRIDRLGEPATAARSRVDVRTDRGFGYVAFPGAEPGYDRWLRLERDPAGWSGDDGATRTFAWGVHPTEGELSHRLSRTPFPPRDPADPLSAPAPPRRVELVDVTATVVVDPRRDGLALDTRSTFALRLRAVGGDVRTLVLDVPLVSDAMPGDTVARVDVGGASVAAVPLPITAKRRIATPIPGRDTTLVDPTRAANPEDGRDRIRVPVVLPALLHPGDEVTVEVVVQGNLPGIQRGDELPVAMWRNGGTLSPQSSTPLIHAVPLPTTTARLEAPLTLRVGVAEEAGLSAAVAGTLSGRLVDRDLRWEEGRTDGPGGLGGYALGAWKEWVALPTSDRPAVRVHLPPAVGSTGPGLVSEALQALGGMGQDLGRYPFGELDVFVGPAAATNPKTGEVGQPATLVEIGQAAQGVVVFDKVDVDRHVPLDPVLRMLRPELEREILTHQLGHQWWGARCWAAHARDVWLEEALARASGWRELEREVGREPVDVREERLHQVVAGRPAARGMTDKIDTALQADQTYTRLTLADHDAFVLDRLVRAHTGDAPFFRALRGLLDAHPGPTTTDRVIGALAAVPGAPSEDELRFWLVERRTPAVHVAWRSSDDHATVDVEGDVPFGTFTLPVRVKLADRSTRDVEVTVVDGVGEAALTGLPAAAVGVEVDPAHRVLLRGVTVTGPAVAGR